MCTGRVSGALPYVLSSSGTEISLLMNLPEILPAIPPFVPQTSSHLQDLFPTSGTVLGESFIVGHGHVSFWLRAQDCIQLMKRDVK